MLLISTSNMHGLTDSLKTGFDGHRTICYIDHPERFRLNPWNRAAAISRELFSNSICGILYAWLTKWSLCNHLIWYSISVTTLKLAISCFPLHWLSIKLETYLEMININYYNLWIEPVSEWVPKIGLTVGWLHPRYEIFRKYRSC